MASQHFACGLLMETWRNIIMELMRLPKTYRHQIGAHLDNDQTPCMHRGVPVGWLIEP